MPGRKISGRNGPYFTDSLKAAIETGAIPVSAVDQAVSRILGQMDRFGLLGRNPPARPASIDIAADAAIVRDIAQQGAVLLKNDGNALPLTADDLGSLAVIGPTGGQLAAGFMGERAYGFESRLVAPLTALQTFEPKAKIRYSAGVDLTGVPIPNFKSLVSLEPDSEGSWTGTVNASRDGNYTFMVQPATGGASRGSGTITVDGRVVARTSGPGFGGGGRVAAKKWSSLLPTTDGRDNARGAIHLAAGAHRIEASAQSTGEAPLSVRFAWMTPDLRRAGVEAAVEAAKAARTPVVFAWNEAGDALALPEDQDELIERVAAANPRTIVVLNTGGPIAMPWRDKVRAILQMWFPGQEGGWATADILLGRANPSGKLPVTFPVRLEDAPARAAGHPERWTTPPAPGSSGISANSPAVNFSEGIAVGYRWYDQQNIQPLFPFGHGLSYTRFEYSGLAVERHGDGLDVSFNLRNAGSRKGAEVAQAYVGPAANAPVPMAQKSLVGFERIDLDAGQTRRVTMHIDARGLSYWSTQKHDWALAGSARPLYVGSSSRDIRIEGKVSLN
jgi:beta-glucosidase